MKNAREDGISLLPAQCRAGRALINWTQNDLAQNSGVAKATIAYFETNKRQPYQKTLSDLRRVMEKAGICFIDQDEGGAGACLKSRT